ncbi:MAG: hypothetical protein R3E57_02500 [Porticoccaceae bacterium]
MIKEKKISERFVEIDALKKQVNTKLAKMLDKESYEVKARPAIDFLTSDRLDLVPKIIYAKWFLHGVDTSYAERLYLAHIETINGFVEADGTGKIGEEAFIQAFNRLISEISQNGLSKRYPVPVSGTAILDGAHRTAIAIALGLDLPTVELSYPPHHIGYKELSFGAIDSAQLDHIVFEYCLLKPSTRMVFIWPSAEGNRDEVERIFENYCQIVYRKEIDLSKNGQSNIVRLAYSKEAWLGTIGDGFIGAQNKADWCFGRRGPVILYVIEPYDDLVSMKEEVRALFNIGKHSIHVNDSYQETVELAQHLLNANGLTFINNHTPENFTWFKTLFQHYKDWIVSNNLNVEDYCVDGSASMAAFGIREARDLDFITRTGNYSDTGFKEIDCHDTANLDYKCSLDELIYNPENHFYYEGYKMISLYKLKEKKLSRSEGKDLLDVSLIEIKLSGASTRSLPVKWRELLRPIRLKAVLKFFALKLRFRLYKIFRFICYFFS